MQLEENLPSLPFSLPTFLAMETWHSLPSLSLSSSSSSSLVTMLMRAPPQEKGAPTNGFFSAAASAPTRTLLVSVCVCVWSWRRILPSLLFVCVPLVEVVEVVAIPGPSPGSFSSPLCIDHCRTQKAVSSSSSSSPSSSKRHFCTFCLCSDRAHRGLLFLPPGVDCISSSGGGALKWVAVSGLVCCISLMNICAWN